MDSVHLAPWAFPVLLISPIIPIVQFALAKLGLYRTKVEKRARVQQYPARRLFCAEILCTHTERPLRRLPAASSKSELRSFRLRSGKNGFRYEIQESRSTLHPHELRPRRNRRGEGGRERESRYSRVYKCEKTRRLFSSAPSSFLLISPFSCT